MVNERGRVGPVARALGYAGLLPQAAAVALLGLKRFSSDDPWDELGGLALVITVTYPLLILSFLGGMWWGLAMQGDRMQGRLATIAILPSLVAFGIAVFVSLTWAFDRAFVATGVAVISTLLVDWRLVRTSRMPDGWMALRVPLSLVLGLLSIAAGIILGPDSVP
jgi:hypothetical protein